MSYDEQDAAMDAFYEQISQELYPEHKEQAIDEFIEERMHSYYLKNPNIIQAPIDSYLHANDLLDISPRCALVMYTTTIELFLKSVLLKPVLFGMINNENIAELIVNYSVRQAGFDRHKKLLNSLCLCVANIELSDIKGTSGKPILDEAEEIQKVRNRVLHQGHKASVDDMEKAKNIASRIFKDVVQPVLHNMNLVVAEEQEGTKNFVIITSDNN